MRYTPNEAGEAEDGPDGTGGQAEAAKGGRGREPLRQEPVRLGGGGVPLDRAAGGAPKPGPAQRGGRDDENS